MSCNSCNRNSAQNYGGNSRNNQMYRSTQLARSGQMNRAGTYNRGVTGRMTNSMTMGNRSESNDCGCKDSMNRDNDYNDNMSNNSKCMEEMSQTYRCDMDSCNQATEPVDSMMVAMAYVPWQQWGDIYDYDKALECGTIFDDLNKPWMGRSCE